MQGWGQGSSQPAKDYAIEKKAKTLTTIERAHERCARQEYKGSLEKDITNLQKKLKQEIDTRKALERAFRRNLGVLPRFSPHLDPKVQELLAEVAVLEEEVINLEECIVEIRQGLYKEAVYLSISKQQKDPDIDTESVASRQGGNPCQNDGIKARRNSVTAKLPCPVEENRSDKCSVIGNSGIRDESRKLVANGISQKKCGGVFQQNSNNNSLDLVSSRVTYKDVRDHETCLEKENQQNLLDKLSNISSQTRNASQPKGTRKMFNGETVEPNLLSEELVWCLSSIFLHLAKQGHFPDAETSSIVSQSTLSSVWSFTSRNSMSCNASRDVTEEIEVTDPYMICAETVHKDIGSYQHYQNITATSFDYSKIPKSAGFLKKMMSLVEKLRMVDLRHLTHHQKLSFWINIYNSCMMHAFLEYGIPDTPHKVVALMGKAGLNVGGHHLSALAIEHFILRIPSELGNIEWKKRGIQMEGFVHNTYGLEWAEPLVSFALCCGSWSSPAVRIYTPQRVKDELEVAKAEYLQATVGVTSTKIVLPKILYWYMRDFAKDTESLLDWVSGQLPSSLSKSMQKCLANKQGKSLSKVVEVTPYDFNFRYLFAVHPI